MAKSPHNFGDRGNVGSWPGRVLRGGSVMFGSLVGTAVGIVVIKRDF
jgi:hypothetical protein